jgi:hypothetical protein
MVTVIEAKDHGRELVVEVRPTQGGTPVRLLVPRELFDDAIGDSADERARRQYVTDNASQIQDVGDAVARGSGTIRMPFTKIKPYGG